MPNDVPDWTLSIQGQVAGEVEAADFKCDGLVGSQVATRWVGAVNGAAPTQIDSIGDHVWDEQGGAWVQTGTDLAHWAWTPTLTPGGDLVLPSAGRGSGNVQAALLKGLSDTGPQGVIDTVTTVKQAILEYRSAGTAKWDLLKDTDDTFKVLNKATSVNTLTLSAADLVTFGKNLRVAGVTGATNGAGIIGGINGGPPGSIGQATGDVVVDGRWGIFWVWNGAVWLPSGGPGPYQARMYRQAAYANSGGPNIIPFDTVDWDPNGNVTTGVSAQYLTPIAGRYRVTVRTGQEATGSGTIRMIVAIFLAGGEHRRTVDMNGTNIIFGGGGTSVVNAAANTSIQGVVNTIPTGSITMDSGQALTYLEVSWEGPS